MNIQKWFEGEIVDVDDPEKLGRVKVKETLGHSNRVSPDDLFWSHVLMPPTGANAKGSGVSPVGLTKDSKVVGFRINDTLSYVIGSVAYVPNEADHSISRHARGVGPVQKQYITELGEKKTEYAAKYPHNKTITTSSVTCLNSTIRRQQSVFTYITSPAPMLRSSPTARSLPSR